MPAQTQQWVTRYDGPVHDDEGARKLAIGPSGNVYVTGESWGGLSTDFDFATAKYDVNGNQLWVARYDGPANGFDTPYALALDNLGNIYVTGASEGIGTLLDYATIKYDTNGNQLWVATYNGPGNGVDEARSIAVDASGNVYITGESWGGLPTDFDFATIKYTQP